MHAGQPHGTGKGSRAASCLSSPSAVMMLMLPVTKHGDCLAMAAAAACCDSRPLRARRCMQVSLLVMGGRPPCWKPARGLCTELVPVVARCAQQASCTPAPATCWARWPAMREPVQTSESCQQRLLGLLVTRRAHHACPAQQAQLSRPCSTLCSLRCLAIWTAMQDTV